MNNFARSFQSKLRVVLLLALAGFVFPAAHGQTCELWTVDAANSVYDNGCITIASTEIDVSAEVSTENYNYVVDVAAEAELYNNSGLVAYVGPICSENGGYMGFSAPCSDGNSGDDVYVATSATYDPTQTYQLNSNYGECYDSSGQGGYGPPEYGGSCDWTYPEGNSETLATSQFNPAYQIATLLYSPPGNLSKSGFGTGTTNGTTTTVANSFTTSSTLTYSGGVPMVFSGGGSIEDSNTTSNSNTFTEQLTSTQSITTDDNSNTAYNQIGIDGKTLSDAIWHPLDTFYILLNPQATVVSDENNNALGYSVALQPLGGSAGQPDMPGIPAVSMENNNLYPYQLNHGVVNTPNGYLYTPGMAAICANVNQSEYQAGTCTQSDQCGCLTSDYNNILSADPLLGWNSSTETGSPYPDTEDPLNLDASGESACLNNPGPSTDCRYVIVPSSTGSTVPLYKPLSGTDGVTYAVTDQTTETQNIGTQHQYSVSITYSLGVLLSGLSATNTWTWTDSASTGVLVGNQNSQSVLLQTGTASCGENVSFYEDTIYHSFVFQIPTGNFGCN